MAKMSFGFRRSLARDRRLGLALFGSALLHALILLSLANHAVPGRAFTRPIFAPLSVRMEHLSESPAEKPIVIDQKKAALHLKAGVSVPVTPSPPAQVESNLPEPGVSLFETAYLKPFGSRVSSPLLASGEFRRASDVSEMAGMQRMRVPSYPREAQAQKLSGWVTVMFFVDEQGKVVETAAVDASESFDSFQIDVAAQMRDSMFRPGKLDGRPVKTLVFTMVRFDAKALSGAANIPSSGGTSDGAKP